MMLPLKKFLSGITLIWLFGAYASHSAQADDLTILPYMPHILTVNYGIDSDDGRNLFLHLNYSLEPRHRIALGFGDQDENVTESEEALDSNTYLFGYTYLASQNYQIGGEVEYWGDDSKLTTDTYRLLIAIDWKKLSLSVSPQYRDITVYTEANCSGKIDSTALNTDLRYYPNEKWALTAGYISYDYSKSRTQLLECVTGQELFLVISRLQTVAIDTQLSVGMERYYKTEIYGVRWSRSESAIDASNSTTLSAFVSTELFEDWTAGVTFGTVENYDESTTSFLQGSLAYYW